MQNAPSVEYPVGLFVWESRLARWAWVGLVLVCLGWVAERLWRVREGAAVDGATWWLTAVAILVGLLWWRWIQRAEAATPSGELLWAGEPSQPDWSWMCAGRSRVVQPRVVLDLGASLWLRLELGGGQAAWVWALRSADPSQWLALRRALLHSADRRLTPRV